MGNFSLQNLFKDAMTGLKYKLSSATNFVSRILVAFCILLTGFVGARDPEPLRTSQPNENKMCGFRAMIHFITEVFWCVTLLILTLRRFSMRALMILLASLIGGNAAYADINFEDFQKIRFVSAAANNPIMGDLGIDVVSGLTIWTNVRNSGYDLLLDATGLCAVTDIPGEGRGILRGHALGGACTLDFFVTDTGTSNFRLFSGLSSYGADLELGEMIQFYVAATGTNFATTFSPQAIEEGPPSPGIIGVTAVTNANLQFTTVSGVQNGVRGPYTLAGGPDPGKAVFFDASRLNLNHSYRFRLSRQSGGGNPILILGAPTTYGSLNVVKSATLDDTDSSGTTNAGDKIIYSVLVTNDGNTTLSGVNVTDTLYRSDSNNTDLSDNPSQTLTLTETTSFAGSLLVGQTAEYDTTYTLLQDDIDAGSVLNSALATGVTSTTLVVRDVSGTSSGNDDPTVTDLPQTPTFTIAKIVDTADISAPASLDYTVTVTNTGNVSLTGATFSDALTQGGVAQSFTQANLTLAESLTTDGVLAVGEEWTYTGSYGADQSNIDDGNDLVNTGTIAFTEAATQSDSATTTITQTPSISVTKALVDPNDFIITTQSAPNDEIEYRITVENTGNVSITGVNITDEVTGGALTAPATIPVPAPTGDGLISGTLDVGETWEYLATYDVTKPDYNSGNDIINTVRVSADGVTEVTSNVTSTGPTFGLTINKELVFAADRLIGAPGDIIEYSIKITNTGTADITGVSVSDVVTGGALPSPGQALNIGAQSGDDTDPNVLNPGETWRYIPSYVVTVPDYNDQSEIVNTATVNTDQTLGVSDSVTSDIVILATFTCGNGKFFQTTGDPSTLYDATPQTNPISYTPIKAYGIHINAIGYNVDDDTIYGYDNDNLGRIVRLLRDGSFSSFYPANLPAVGYIVGDFAPSGGEERLFIAASNGNFHIIDIDQETVVQSVTLDTSISIADWAYREADDLFYAYDRGQGMVTISRTGVVNAFTDPSPKSGFGAMYADGAGNIYGYNNGSGNLYQFDVTTGIPSIVSEGPSVSINDAAFCRNATTRFNADISVTKIADAPDYNSGDVITYTIVASNNGPFGAIGITLADIVPTGFTSSDMTYTAVVAGGATTSVPAGGGTGDILDAISVPVGATVTYTVKLQTSSTFSGDVENTASVSLPANVFDPVPDNNSATVTTPVKSITLGIQTRTFDGFDSFTYTATNSTSFPNPYVNTTAASWNPVTGPIADFDQENTLTEIVQTALPGWVIVSAICTDVEASTTGNPSGAVIGSLSGNTLTIPVANVLSGSDFICQFDNRFVGFAIQGRVLTDDGAAGGTAYDAIATGGESGLAGVTVRLTDCGTTVYSSTATNGNGDFALSLIGAPTDGTEVCVERRNIGAFLGVSGNAGDTTTGSIATPLYDRISQIVLTANTSYTGVVFGVIPLPTLEQDQTVTMAPGDVITIPHRYTASSVADVTFSLVDITGLPADSFSTTRLYRDTDCSGTLDAGEPELSSSISVSVAAAGNIDPDEVCLLTRVQTSGSAPSGAVLEYDVRAETDLPNTGTQATIDDIFDSDTATVTANAALTLIKRVCNETTSTCGDGDFSVASSGEPGDVLVYRLTFENPTDATILDVKLFDETPSYTALSGATPIFVVTHPDGKSGPLSCTVSNQTSGYAGDISWSCPGLMVPGARGVVGFSVQIAN
jgi:uncharacterized repeat protein (TIGR01451 family)